MALFPDLRYRWPHQNYESWFIIVDFIVSVYIQIQPYLSIICFNLDNLKKNEIRDLHQGMMFGSVKAYVILVLERYVQNNCVLVVFIFGYKADAYHS